jgi:hypothetical protein
MAAPTEPNPPSAADVQELYDRSMSVSAEAFAAGLYNVAYHALASASHCARLLPDDERLARVARTATQQIAEIDQVAPEYEHSTQSAAARGHHNIFTLLAKQATTLIDERNVKRRFSAAKGTFQE